MLLESWKTPRKRYCHASQAGEGAGPRLPTVLQPVRCWGGAGFGNGSVSVMVPYFFVTFIFRKHMIIVENLGRERSSVS